MQLELEVCVAISPIAFPQLSNCTLYFFYLKLCTLMGFLLISLASGLAELWACNWTLHLPPHMCNVRKLHAAYLLLMSHTHSLQNIDHILAAIPTIIGQAWASIPCNIACFGKSFWILSCLVNLVLFSIAKLRTCQLELEDLRSGNKPYCIHSAANHTLMGVGCSGPAPQTPSWIWWTPP